MINGKRFAWEDVTIRLPQGTAVDVSKIEYGDEKDIRPVYGKGSMPRGFGSGNYKAEGKLTLLREEYERLLTVAKVLTPLRLYNLTPVEVVVSYANEDQPTVTDTLQQVKFTKVNTSADQGAEKVEVELDFVILGGIRWNGLQADVNP